MFVNETINWRNILLNDNIVANSVLDPYLYDLGFVYYKVSDLKTFLECDFKLTLQNESEFCKVSNFYETFDYYKNGCLVLDSQLGEKRFILVILNTLIFLIYRKKGSNKLKEIVSIGRLSFTNLCCCDILTFDNKLNIFTKNFIENNI